MTSQTFTNTQIIYINNSGPSSPSPSTINVSGVSGDIQQVTLAMKNFTHYEPNDLTISLVGPDFQSTVLMSGAGFTYDVENQIIAFNDNAANSVPQYSQILPGVYKPTNYGSGSDSNLSVFNGTNPNGNWNLFIDDNDNISGTNGNIADGWEITINTIADEPPSIFIADASIKEGDSGTSQMGFDVTLSNTVSSPVAVKYNVVSGTAKSGQDFIPSAGTLQFSPGQTKQTIFVDVLGDSVIESSENFQVILSQPTNGIIAISKATGTIIDNDITVPNISFASANVSTMEGDTGTKILNIPVILSKSSDDPVKVTYTTLNDTADNKDFISSKGTLTFKPGQTQQNIKVQVKGDRTAEMAESFTVKLSKPVNGEIETATATATISDNDLVEISVDDVIIKEGTGGKAIAKFKVDLSTDISEPLSISYATSNNTAKSPQDFSSSQGKLKINSGQTTGFITVPIKTDNLKESNETFSLKLTGVQTSVNAAIQDKIATGFIVDDDPIPTISIKNANVKEGNAGKKKVNLSVTLSNPSEDKITVKYKTVSATAKGNQDFQSKSGTLTFGSGKTSETISTSVFGDFIPEKTERFFVKLSGSKNAILKGSQATITIRNDDKKNNKVANNLVDELTNSGGILVGGRAQNDILVGRYSALGDFNYAESGIASQRDAVMTSLHQATTLEQLTSSISSLINIDTSVVI